jgi:hypothetical protein
MGNGDKPITRHEFYQNLGILWLFTGGVAMTPRVSSADMVTGVVALLAGLYFLWSSRSGEPRTNQPT